jgi:cytochrome c5
MIPRLLLACAFALAATTPASGATGEQIYRDKCSVCHDGGGAGAPRLGHREDWGQRLARGVDAVHRAALTGIPDSAMAAKGGFRELSDAEVRAAVDYMIERAGPPVLLAPQAPPAVAPPRQPRAETPENTPRADAAITTAVAAAFGAAGEAIPSGIKIETAEGVVTLNGTVHTAEEVRRAEQIARSVGGVREVRNRLIASALFEWD